MKRHKTVDEYLDAADKWQDALRRLREILLRTELEETVKWGAPCYTFDGKNVVGLGGFKSYFGLWFFQGAMLADELGVLVNAQEGRTKALRQWRFESIKEIRVRSIQAYVREAIELARQGREIKPVPKPKLGTPLELQQALDEDTAAAAAFAALTPGRRREYVAYVAEAKREQTRQKRIEKILPMIRSGQGLNDRYRG